jgi:hypothetical protein
MERGKMISGNQRVNFRMERTVGEGFQAIRRLTGNSDLIATVIIIIPYAVSFFSINGNAECTGLFFS